MSRLMLHGALRTGALVAPPEGCVLVGEGALTLVCSPLAAALDDADQAARFALAHNRILASIAADIDIAPVAFGGVAENEAEARTALREQRLALEAALLRIRGCVEYSARISARQGAGLQERGPSEAAPPEEAEARTGRSYLAARGQVRAAKRSRAELLGQLFEQAEARLGAHARETLRRPLPPAAVDAPARLFDIALLVERERAPALIAAGAEVYALADALGVTFEISGPWPAYHFADGRLDHGAAQEGAAA